MSDSQNTTVLIVDDDLLNREMLQVYLDDKGYRVIQAGSAEKALEIIAADQPDLILTDVRMPGMDGYEFCRKLKADPALRHIPVAIVTGLRGDKEDTQAVAAGVDDLIDKPFTPSVMLNRIKTLLRLKQLHDALETYQTEVEKTLTAHLDGEVMATIKAELATKREQLLKNAKVIGE